ncbi:MAG: hypothetical protein HY675_10765 [Chloroflexi bacterium]|nr:hypothetical protein [Chloroflexota bacterium]
MEEVGDMLFMVTARHTTERCPLGTVQPDPDFATELLNAAAEEKARGQIRILHGYAAAPEHTFWFVVETDSTEALCAFCLPLQRIGTVSFSPVLTIEDQVNWMSRQGESKW